MADKQSKSFLDKLKNIFSSQSATKNAKGAMLMPYRDTTQDKEKKPKDENKKLKNKFGF